jgi:hypothetical protein
LALVILPAIQAAVCIPYFIKGKGKGEKTKGKDEFSHLASILTIFAICFGVYLFTENLIISQTALLVARGTVIGAILSGLCGQIINPKTLLLPLPPL